MDSEEAVKSKGPRSEKRDRRKSIARRRRFGDDADCDHRNEIGMMSAI
jgi:hypothetical protein